MRYKHVSILSLFVFVCVLETKATPSTQVWIPSTDVQAFLKPHIGWDIYMNTFGNGLISNGGVTMGVIPSGKLGLEIGIDYRDGSGVHGNPILFNAKLGLAENSFSKFMPAIAIGGYDFGTKDNVSNYNIAYGLISKTIWKLGRFSVGGYKGLGPDELWMSSEGKVRDVGVLLSWDRVMNELTDKLWLAVDFQSGNNSYGALNFGVGWSFAPNVGVVIGYDIYNDSDISEPTFTMQFDINLF